MEQRYLVKIGQQIIGEFSFVEVQQQLRTGKITKLHRVSTDGGQCWESVHRVAELQIATGRSDQPQSQAAQDNREQPVEQQSSPPQQNQPNSAAEVEQWYVTMSSGEQVGQKYGPFTKEEVGMWVQQGRVSAADLVWAESLEDWKPVYMVFETVNFDSANQNESPGFLKTIFRTRVRAQPKRKIPKEEQSWSLICIASAAFSFMWLGGLGSIAGIVLAVIGLFEVFSSKGYKRGVLPCVIGLLLGMLGAFFSFVMFFGFR